MLPAEIGLPGSAFLPAQHGRHGLAAQLFGKGSVGKQFLYELGLDSHVCISISVGINSGVLPVAQRVVLPAMRPWPRRRAHGVLRPSMDGHVIVNLCLALPAWMRR